MNVAHRDENSTEAKKLARDLRGAIMVEYLVLLSTVTIGFAIAILALGPFLVADFERSQAFILSPFP